MDIIEGILTRRSIRAFDASKKVSKSDIEKLIRAAQYAPSAHNKQEWEFIVIEDDEKKAGLRQIQPWTSFAKDASCVIVICSNENETFSRNKDDEKWSYGEIDGALAAQNLMLAAHSMGIGTCFCGAAPMPRVVEGLQEYLSLPNYIRPIAIIVVGYAQGEVKQPSDRYNPDRIHWEKW